MAEFWKRSPLVAAALLAGCASRLVPTATQIPAARGARIERARTASPTPFDRQIRNALDAGEGDAMLKYLRQKVAAEPDHLAARLALAERYETQGAPELAIEHYRLATQYAPASEPAARRLAAALQKNDQPGDAIAALVRFCDSQASSADVLAELAIAFDEEGRYAEGEGWHRKAILAAADRDDLRNNLGFNFLRQGRLPDAVHEFRAALLLNPKSETARGNLALALAATPETRAEALLQWQSMLGPAAAHSNLASVLIENGQYSDARLQLAEALQYDRTNAAALRNLQLLADLDGQPASVPARVPDGSTTKNRLARWWRRITGPPAAKPTPTSTAHRTTPGPEKGSSSHRVD
jgi:tetratricopeptide (TPR) repeat protein